MLSLLRLRVKHNALPFSPSSAQLFWNMGEYGAKKYFTHHQTAITIHLFAAMKGSFSCLFFLTNLKGTLPEAT